MGKAAAIVAGTHSTRRYERHPEIGTKKWEQVQIPAPIINYQLSIINYSAMMMSSIAFAESAIRVPGPKMAATPQSYRNW